MTPGMLLDTSTAMLQRVNLRAQVYVGGDCVQGSRVRGGCSSHRWHLGQRQKFLPTSRGFDAYLGIPFSQDMGLSYWFDCMGDQKPGAKYGVPCNPTPTDPYQPVPVPLLANTTPIAQPAGLYTLAKRCVVRRRHHRPMRLHKRIDRRAILLAPSLLCRRHCSQ